MKKSVFVEIVRLLIVLLATAAGYEIASGRGASLAGVTLGAAIGYVSGGILGRELLKAMGAVEARAAGSTAAEFFAGSVGALLVGALATLLGVSAVGLLPGRWGWPLFALIAWIGVYAGFRIGSRKSADLLAMAGLSEGTRAASAPPDRDAVLLDTSVLLDDRLLKVARSGFLNRDLLVPHFVLDELKGIADSGEPNMRRRGRRGLETVDELRRDPFLRVQVPDDELPSIEEIDAKLVALASRLSVGLMTNDQPLASIAEIRGVRCLNLHKLASGLRSVRMPGERIRLAITQEGREAGEGVGFLEDGSMVVVGQASDLVGQEADVHITSSVRTPIGRMFFASLVDP